MIPAKNYFSGGLGKLKNIGGSRFFTTPHTVQVPAEYEIISGSQGEFIACSLDGRLWLFDDKLTVLKWNSSSLRMEIAKSIEIGDLAFIARGIDWILTTSSFFQVLDEAPYIFSEQVSFNENFSVDKFYSFLPEISGWQIIKNFLVRRSGNEDEASLHSLSIPASLYLTHLDDGIYGKDNSHIGIVSIEDNGSGYELVISPDYSTATNVSGLAFLDKTLYGFKLKQDSSMCPMSADSLLYNPEAGSWSNVFDGNDTSGNIFFDPFNYKALAVRDDAVNLLPEKKIFTAKGISQWFAPTKNIANITSDFTIAPLEHDILTTHLSSGLYREILHQKDLALSSRAYLNYKLSIGENENVLQFNKIACKQKKQQERYIKLLVRPVDDFDYDFDFIYDYYIDGHYCDSHYYYVHTLYDDIPFFYTSVEVLEYYALAGKQWGWDGAGINPPDKEWRIIDGRDISNWWKRTDDNFQYSYPNTLGGRYYYLDLDTKSLIVQEELIDVGSKSYMSHNSAYVVHSFNFIENEIFRLRITYELYNNEYWGKQDNEYKNLINTSTLYSNWEKISNNKISVIRISKLTNASYFSIEFKENNTGTVYTLDIENTNELPYKSTKIYDFRNKSTGEIIHVIFLINENMIKHVLLISNFEI